MYRIQNEERWIEKSLESASEVCQEIVILDDCSTDNTVNICKKFPKVVDIYERKEPLPLDEVRDRNILLELALKLDPDYILTIDGDEVLMPNSKEILYEELSVLYPNAKVLYLQILDVWDKPNQIRIDGIYGKTWSPRLIKVEKTSPILKFYSTKYDGNLHCYNSLIEEIQETYFYNSTVKLLHYSNFNKEIRQKKFEYYNKIDPNSIEQDGYKHVISGEGIHSGFRGIELMQLPDFMC